MKRKELLRQFDLFQNMVWHKYQELTGREPYPEEVEEKAQAIWGKWCDENGVFLLDPALVEEHFNEKADQFICVINPDKDEYYFWALFPVDFVEKALILKSLP